MYEQKLKNNNSVDFDDLILLPYILLSEDKEVRKTLQDRWYHVMVDEFQDTNEAQFQLIKLLSPEKLLNEDSSRSLFVVGDNAQSIYAFRGSKIEIILNFPNEYKNSREIILNQNYRSTQPILDLAEKILTHNPKQRKKNYSLKTKKTLKLAII
jgi:DNA helicase-2/ATP-dependent DNA helicase PcrA